MTQWMTLLAIVAAVLVILSGMNTRRERKLIAEGKQPGKFLRVLLMVLDVAAIAAMLFCAYKL